MAHVHMYHLHSFLAGYDEYSKDPQVPRKQDIAITTPNIITNTETPRKVLQKLLLPTSSKGYTYSRSLQIRTVL